MKHYSGILSIVLFSFLLSGCAPFSKYYVDTTGGKDITKDPAIELSSAPPRMLRGTNVADDSQRMLEDGYVQIGHSSFNGSGNVRINGALAKAEDVHAEVVIVYSKYTGTLSGVMPLQTPTTTMSTTNMRGNVYGTGGQANYTGTAQTTTYGTQTTYMPYNVARYNWGATYWVKVKPLVLGVRTKDLPNDVRQRIGSNKGALVVAVMKGSPAFMADILKDDIIRKIGDDEIYDFKSVHSAVQKYEGQKVTIELIRGSETITKEVQLNKSSY